MRVAALLVLSIFLTGCSFGCISYPKVIKNKKGDIIEPQSCIDYKICLYYVARGKINSNCDKQFDQCRRDRTYQKCGDENLRWDNSTPQSCWDKLD